MSDFIYSSVSKSKGELPKYIQRIYHTDKPKVYEYHGTWGSLAVSRNLYNGFQPLETDTHIFVVVGGPVLCFRSNDFLTGNNPTAGTEEIYERWQTGSIKWDEDLSGPFVVLVVDKKSTKIQCITDLMMFIPVYQYAQDGIVMLGTQVDALAAAADHLEELDHVSLVDFVLNNAVTYPYTFFKRIRQCNLAAVHSFDLLGQELRVFEPEIYWLPAAGNNLYKNIDQAAKALRECLQVYISRVTENMEEVAQFLSAGEDSRALAGMLPRKLKRNAFVFLDSMNREGRIAKNVASAYGARFHAEFRGETHYLDILPEASDLIGSGFQHKHAHSLGFHKTCALDRYPAVFGGFSSDVYLKAFFIRKIRGAHRFPFLPQFFIPGETRSKLINNSFFSDELLSGINRRRKDHLKKIMEVRKDTAHEWFMIWPNTMRPAMANLYSNRRLFRIYEPFMCNEVVKISASVPTVWKLNRRLFHKTVRPFLEPSRLIFSNDGRFPYFPWWLNTPIQFYVWLVMKIFTLMGLMRNNQGPWGDWNRVMKSRRWKDAILRYSNGFEPIRQIATTDSAEKIFKGNKLKMEQKINFIQLLYILSPQFAFRRISKKVKMNSIFEKN
jgi:hypothetical protein